MDRRYREAQLSDTRGPLGQGQRGIPSSQVSRREALVRQYLAQARKANSQAQSYGGSTGRPGGFYGSEAMSQRQVVAATRGAEAQDRRRIFEQEGSPRSEAQLAYPGGRSVVAEARGYGKPPATA